MKVKRKLKTNSNAKGTHAPAAPATPTRWTGKKSTKTGGDRKSAPTSKKNPAGVKVKAGKLFRKQAPRGQAGVIQQRRKLVVKPSTGEKWFAILDMAKQSEAEESVQDEKPITKEEIQAIEARAGKLLENDCEGYRRECLSGEKRSDFMWMDGIMKNGTLPDKMAAYIVRVQDSPIHNLGNLQQLISMVKVQGRQQCLMTADTTRDLFLEDLLPPGRKLASFESRGAKLRNASDKELIVWTFEHRLKLQYQNFIEALKKMSTDQVDKMRGKAIVVASRLLISHPEHEQTLLELLVNKLGDPVKKVASKALFHLSEVVREHPLMKLIVVQEVERLLFRNNIGKKAQYYGICFLNVISLNHAEAQLAVKLVTVYLAFFKACVKTGEIDSKLMGGLLNGVNRAFPIAKMAGMEFGESLDTLFKIVQLSQFNIGIQALSLLFQVTDADKNPSNADRFYNALYRKLMSDDLFTTSHNLQLVNLTYKAMKKDKCLSRILGFTKRLLQVSSGAPPNIACALLYLISEVSKVHKNILLLGTPLKDEPESNSGSLNEDEAGADETQSNERLADFEELVKTTNIVQKHVEVKLSKRKKVNPDEVINVEDMEDTDPVTEVKDEAEECRVKHYDPTARNPKFCGAELTFAYELVALSRHAHPSVALFAETLLRPHFIRYTGNPIRDFTTSRFLERFVYRNAKVDVGRHKYQPAGLRNVPVNSNSYLDAKEEDIPVEEKFFYKFFKNQKNARRVIKKEKEGDDDEEEASDAESIGDEEFESIMSNYFKQHGPHDDSSDDGDDDEIDFASEIKKGGKKSKGGKVAESDEESDDADDDIEQDDENGEDADDFVLMDSEDEPEFDGDDDDLDNEDDSLPPNIFDDDDDEFIDQKAPSTSRKNAKSKMGRQGTFAPAEHFSEILEANADMAFSGSHDLINRDNADMKQLKWEMNRDRWVKGHTNKKSFKRNPGTSSGGKGKRRKFK